MDYPFATNINELSRLVQIIEGFGISLYFNRGEKVDVGYSNERSPESVQILKNAAKYIQKIIFSLPYEQRKVIELRYYKGRTFDEIRDNFGGVSKSWVSRRHRSALEMIRDALISDETLCRERKAAYDFVHAA